MSNGESVTIQLILPCTRLIDELKPVPHYHIAVSDGSRDYATWILQRSNVPQWLLYDGKLDIVC